MESLTLDRFQSLPAIVRYTYVPGCEAAKCNIIILSKPANNDHDDTILLLSTSLTARSSLGAIARMLLKSFRRPGRFRRSCFRLTIFLLLIALCVDFLLTIIADPPFTRVSPTSSHGSPKERLFIASMHWNNEWIIRTHWSAAILNLVRHYGAENVYISIQESGSWDNTKGALLDLDRELHQFGVERAIVLNETTHQDEIDRIHGPDEEGWIWTSRGKKELRRIPYLAGIRNKIMEKFHELAERPEGKRHFDKILWLNDVIFTVCAVLFTSEVSVQLADNFHPSTRPRMLLHWSRHERVITQQPVPSTFRNLLHTTILSPYAISPAPKRLPKPGPSSSHQNPGMP